MGIKKEYFLTALSALFLLTGVLAGYTLATNQVRSVNSPGVPLNSDSEEGLKTIVITGEGIVVTKPDIGKISLGVQTYSETAEEALQLNSGRMSKVIEALEGLGLSEENFETGSINLYPQYSKEDPPRIVGYMATNTINIEFTDLSVAGKIIDTAVNAGANQVFGVYFQLSEEKAASVKLDALKIAATDARTKAELIALTLGVEIVGVLRVSESYTPIYPYRSEAAVFKADTPVFPGEVQGYASIQVTFLIK
ncbi:MAG: SIMPL domain-containing protein [Candidatus Bathyarchaeia archaeon]